MKRSLLIVAGIGVGALVSGCAPEEGLDDEDSLEGIESIKGIEDVEAMLPASTSESAAKSPESGVTRPLGAIYFPPGQISGKFNFYGCVVRIWYGNYGSTPFAKVWRYPGGSSCGYIHTAVGGLNGSNLFWSWDSGIGVAQYDPWGEGMNELQATGPAPAYGVGQKICYGGSCSTFWYQ